MRVPRRSPGYRRASAAAQLDRRVGRSRPAADRLQGPGGHEPGKTCGRSGRPLGQRSRGLRADDSCCLCRPAAGIYHALLLESAGVGCARAVVALECDGPLVDGPVERPGMEGPVDRRCKGRREPRQTTPQRLSQRDRPRGRCPQVGRHRPGLRAILRRRAALSGAAVRLETRHARFPVPRATQDRGRIGGRRIRPKGHRRSDCGRRPQSRRAAGHLSFPRRDGTLRTTDRYAAGAARQEQLRHGLGRDGSALG